jgi:hypothetical protein
MMSLPTARRRAEELDAAVSGSARDASAPSADLEPLLDVVAQLRAEAAASVPVPRADFAADLRARLMTEAATVLVAPDPATDELLTIRRSPHAPRRQRRVTAVAAALVVAGGSSTMAYAAQGALPGDSLYPVKRALEGARGSISLTDESRGALTLRHAEQRLAEVQGLVDRHDTASDALVSDALATFVEQSDEAAELLLAAGAQGDDRSVTDLRGFVAGSVATLADLEPSLSVTDQEGLAAAVAALRDIDERALELCPTCGSSSAVELPFALANAASMFDEGLFGENAPVVPDVDVTALPPGSVAGPQDDGTSVAAPPETAPPATGGNEEPSTPSQPPTAAPSEPSAPTSPPPSPELPGTSGGITGATEGITGLTGPLAEPLQAITETLDTLLGLKSTP